MAAERWRESHRAGKSEPRILFQNEKKSSQVFYKAAENYTDNAEKELREDEEKPNDPIANVLSESKRVKEVRKTSSK